jgi:SAM-dependent methyltransferase
MSLERIDPILREDFYCVDHLLRYAAAIPLAKGKRVLDAACGVGFGAVMLAQKEAKEVIGLDNSEEGIGLCRERWQLENLKYECGDLEKLNDETFGKFDLITSFETLEHVEDPSRILERFEAILEEGGVLFGSVPGRTDRYEENPFHLHYFTEESLRQLLEKHFKHVSIVGQSFSIKSNLHPMGQNPPPEPMEWKEEACLHLDFGRTGPEEDSLVFFASNETLSPMKEGSSASSRLSWRRLRSEYLDCMQELHAFSKKYEGLFLEYGDLKVKFANVLGWGMWHYKEHQGESPSGTAMDQVVNAVSEREAGLREQIDDLRGENDNLRKQLAEMQSVLTAIEKDGLAAFNKGVDNL